MLAGLLCFGNATGSGPQFLKALNAVTGRNFWERSHANAILFPTLYNSVIYTPAAWYGLDGFNAADGNTGCSFQQRYHRGNPMVVNNVVYAGTEGSIVTAYEVLPQVQSGFTEIPRGNVSVFSPTLYKGYYIQHRQPNYLYAIDSAAATWSGNLLRVSTLMLYVHP